MNSTPCPSLSSPPVLSPKLRKHPARYPIGPNRLRLRKSPITIRSATLPDGCGHGKDYGAGLVDENIDVLRKRIRELGGAERIYPDPQENGWTEREKNYFESCYGSDVCQAAGLIQMFAMSVRPGVALGLVGLMLCSVPFSVILMGLQLGQALRTIVH